ncbi:hypothetical protein [Sandaracinobacteroides saxicola]|uniref:Uncharacterized protein n=1 Tax=Sandaracinobacteroides saxicola TaxID=2759707 RepID=A0A7G5IJ57_9SPHN|nr:hypothetical protein [Sandaracinobacteroides saxicola]QMW23399.1 hypothetical protein H3309_02530 [Sandaracinobacteroides saxicola]
MKPLLLALLLGAIPLNAAPTPRLSVGDLWIDRAEMATALQPMAALARRVVNDRLCPSLVPGPGGVIYTFDIEAKYPNSYELGTPIRPDQVRIRNPSGCPALDAEVAALMQAALPRYAEPKGFGWLRAGKVRLQLAD